MTFVDQTTANICVGNITTAPHPSDPTKFLMCDIKGQLLTVQCPPNETFCAVTNLCQVNCPTSTAKISQQTTTPILAPSTNSASSAKPLTSSSPNQSTTPKNPIIIIVLTTGPPLIVGSGTASVASTTTPSTGPQHTTPAVITPITTQIIPTTTQRGNPHNSIPNHSTQGTTNPNCHQNPCTANALMNSFLYFPACDEHEFYHCTGINTMTTERCPTDKIYNPNIFNCVNEFVYNEDTLTFDKTITNPCKYKSGDAYLVHPTDNSKFIHCDGFWNGFMRTCPSGEVFSQTAQTCISSLSSLIG